MEGFNAGLYLIVIISGVITGFIVYKIFFNKKGKHTQAVQPKAVQNRAILTSLKTTTTKIENTQVSTNEKIEEEPVEIETKVTEGNVIPNALVFDKEHRSFGLRRITTIPGKDYGQPYTRYNFTVFLLEKTKKEGKKGNYFPLEIKETIDHTPGELYEALQTREDVRILWGSRTDPVDKFKIWWFILGIVAAILIAFMSTQAGKGSSHASLIVPLIGLLQTGGFINVRRK